MHIMAHLLMIIQNKGTAGRKMPKQPRVGLENLETRQILAFIIILPAKTMLFLKVSGALKLPVWVFGLPRMIHHRSGIWCLDDKLEIYRSHPTWSCGKSWKLRQWSCFFSEIINDMVIGVPQTIIHSCLGFSLTKTIQQCGSPWRAGNPQTNRTMEHHFFSKRRCGTWDNLCSWRDQFGALSESLSGGTWGIDPKLNQGIYGKQYVWILRLLRGMD